MPSNIAAVTLALRHALKAAVPSDIEVTTLAPAEAEHFSPHGRTLARLNLALYRIANSPHRPNAGFVRQGAPAPERPSLLPFDLRYLLTAYGPSDPADKNSAERLLEAALRVLSDNPVLSSAQLQAALPGETAADPNRRATIEFEDLTQAELLNLFTNLRAQWRPALTLLVRLSES